MRLIKFELKKVFYNKFFLGILLFTVFLNVFSLYEITKTEKSLSAPYEVTSYDDFLDSVQSNAEQSLSVSIFSSNLSEFSKRNIQKSARDLETLRGIQIKEDENDGIMLLFSSGVLDLSILLLLVTVGMSLITDEKEKKLFRLIHSTEKGTVETIFSKITTLFLCCVFINVVISGVLFSFAYFKYGFGDMSRSIQSVPELLTCPFRLNVAEFMLLFFSVKTLGVFVVGMGVLLCCLFCNRAVSMLAFVALLGMGNVVMTWIPETSSFQLFKYINLYSFFNPYAVLSSYRNLNLFGYPIRVTVVFTVSEFLCLFAFAFLSIFCFVKKRPLENREKRTVPVFCRESVHGSIAYFEFKKLAVLNKVTIILLVFALLQAYTVYKQENFQSAEEYKYKYYIEMLQGPLNVEKETLILSEKSKIEHAEIELQNLYEQKQKGQITMQEFIRKQESYAQIVEQSDAFLRIYDKYLYIKENPNAEFFYDTGYLELFGISNSDFSIQSTILMFSVLFLCLCSVYAEEYKSKMYKILSATEYGIVKTRRKKAIVLVSLAALIFTVSVLPELIYIGRFYGFNSLSLKLVAIQELSPLKALPIWCGIVILYLLRFGSALLLLPIISAVSLKTKNNVLTAILCFIIFVVPIGLYAVTHIPLFADISLWTLFSGSIFKANTSHRLPIMQLAVLSFLSVGSTLYVKCKFGKSNV